MQFRVQVLFLVVKNIHTKNECGQVASIVTTVPASANCRYPNTVRNLQEKGYSSTYSRAWGLVRYGHEDF